MKKQFLLLISLIFLSSCVYHGNDDDINNRTAQSQFEPVTTSRESFEASISMTEAKSIFDSGKIYVQGGFLFVNERKSGFHVIDNSNPENPTPVAFLNVPLATDLAIRGNVIYVHHAVDLVALQYDPGANTVEVLHREKNVFPQLISPDGYDASYYGIQEDKIIIDYSFKN